VRLLVIMNHFYNLFVENLSSLEISYSPSTVVAIDLSSELISPYFSLFIPT